MGKAACEAHETHRQRCGECATVEMEAMVMRDFPPLIVEPWQKRVDEALKYKWTASIRPLTLDSVDGAPIWTLTRQGGGRDREGWSMSLHGPDAERVLAAAKRFDSRRIV